MLELLSRVTKDIVTESDGQSFDIARILWIAGTLVFLALSIWAVVKNHQPVDFMNWGAGFGAILGGGGASVGLRAKFENGTPENRS